VVLALRRRLIAFSARVITGTGGDTRNEGNESGCAQQREPAPTRRA